MGYITKYGTVWGQIPLTHGRIFFVAPSASYTVEGRTYIASNDNDGLSPERALLTIQRGLNLCSANVGDVVFCLPGTHTVTALITMSTAGVTLWGAASSMRSTNLYQPKTIITSTGTNTPLIAVTADNIEIGHVDLRPTSGYSAVIFPTAVTAAAASTVTLDSFYLHDFHIDLETPAVHLGTTGVDFGYRNSVTTTVGNVDTKFGKTTTAITNVLIENGVIESDGAQGIGIILATCYATVRNVHCLNSTGTWATAFQVATAADNILIDNCHFTSTGTITLSIDGSTADNAGGCVIKSCTFGNFGTSNVNSVDAIRGFGAGEVQVIDCYAGSIANGTTSATAISRMTG